ncbi:MAG: hypothetical protein HQM13_13630 [SAR324 cluster bacterium]|nr:hypothetical protein [SAR324 cluster bacterium]
MFLSIAAEDGMGFKKQVFHEKKQAALAGLLLFLFLLPGSGDQANAIHQYGHAYPQCLLTLIIPPAAAVGAVLIVRPNNFGEERVNDLGTISVGMLGGLVLGLFLTEQCNDFFFFIDQTPIVSQTPSRPPHSILSRPDSIILNLFTYRF